MASNHLTFVTMNCQGHSNIAARADTLIFLKSKQYAVYFLQDTHFTNKEEHNGGMSVFSVISQVSQEE